MAQGNKTIGRFHHDGIPPAPRGIPQIEVTFDIDANGILHVSAKDKGTGREQRIRIEASSGLSEDEIRRMRDEAKANEAADKAAREMVDKINAADSMIFQTEKQMKEYGDKIPADKKGRIENALGQLREAHKNKDVTGIDRALAEINAAWQAASEDMYKQAQGGPGQQAGPDAGQQAGPTGGQAGGKGGDEQVTDVDFEEVK
jgi:molecular chaperone DnaK